MKTKILLPVLILILLLSACSPAEPPAQDIRGSWTYTMNDAQGSFYDQGTITFNGSANEGRLCPDPMGTGMLRENVETGEVDLLARYLERLLSKDDDKGVTMEFLRANGYV